MTYQELVTKLIEIQKHMMPDLEKFEREDRLPHDLKVAKAEIIEWEHTVDGDGGLEDAPEIWPVEKFARALRDHYDDFNDFMRRNIAEYEVLAGQLPRPSPTRSASRLRSTSGHAPRFALAQKTSVECQPVNLAAIFESRLNRRLSPVCGRVALSKCPRSPGPCGPPRDEPRCARA